MIQILEITSSRLYHVEVMKTEPLTSILAAASESSTAQAILITVFGDALYPRRQPTSVVDLALLVAPLGVNERAVRTALLRLSRENVVASKREGRHSLYSVAPESVETFRRAEARIYGDASPDWNGEWTVAIIDPSSEASDRARFQRELRWMGMATLQTGVLVSPTIDTDTVFSLAQMHRVTLTALFRSSLASGQLAGDPQLAAFTDPSGQLHELHEAHIAKWAQVKAVQIAPETTFAYRTTLIDDWRRIALRTVDAPRELLPDTWLGDSARSVTHDLYDDLFAMSEEYLDVHLGPASSKRRSFSPVP